MIMPTGLAQDQDARLTVQIALPDQPADVRRSPSPYERVVKPSIDRCGGIVLVALLAPVLAAVAVCVLFSLGPPMLSRQTRVGLHGRTFEMLKFRTMKPRHTHLGRILRRYSSMSCRSCGMSCAVI